METIYNTIGTSYNATRQADPFLVGRLLHFLEPKPDKLYLDIGCGTGNYTIALANQGLDFVGVEPSEAMLKEARKRNERITWLQGTAEQIPVEDNSFDSAIATLTIHHWANLNQSLKEIYRATKLGARLVIFTATRQQMEGYWLNHYFPGMLSSAIAQMPSFDLINDALTKAGFEIATTEKYFVKDDLQDNFLYTGKHRPALYLNEEIRKGISSFAALSNATEVEAGLSKLHADLESGQFINIKKTYENDLGDYLFIVAERKTAIPVI
ncbi:class I SAM-dependent methyltransferase [Mucilaginibacter sp.]|uniref:class I SAM-dependent methyltransferase n=1 Tax=Mucilaginibacter sp. TaxID=1882438 RepID=UPI0026262BD2|nr:class I SAM-dependent methyltransferase [Mucilaginibacter sp.]MDB4919808.1 Ubiquinone/menaquinone biosynthesis C-methylase UbiE [Mucilaginibacter sp.]